jgi:hypothetical protein
VKKMADLTLNEYSGLKDEEIKIILLEEQDIILSRNRSNEPAPRIAIHVNETRRFKKIRHFIFRYFRPISFKKIPVLKQEQI